MAPQQDREGTCDDPDLRAIGWIGPAPTGWHQPILLLISRAPASAGKLRKIVRLAGLRHDAVLHARGALLQLPDDRAATLILGAQRVGPLPVSGEWVTMARERGQVVLMIGTLTVPEDMEPDSYLDRHGDEVVTGVLEVAGAAGAGCRCAFTLATSGRLCLPGQPSAEWEAR